MTSLIDQSLLFCNQNKTIFFSTQLFNSNSLRMDKFSIMSMQNKGKTGKKSGGCGLKEAAAHGEPQQEQAPGWSCSLWRGADAGAGDLEEAAVLWGTHVRAVCS